MKSKITKITSLTMALLVLLSTFSFTVEKHFCGNFLVDVSYFGNPDSCIGEISKDTCTDSVKLKKKKCCKDEVHKIDGQDDLNTFTKQKITFKQQFALLFTISYQKLFVNLASKNVSFKEYSPPNLAYNIQILYEVFII